MEHVRLCQVVDILNAAHKVAACGDAACSPPQPWQLVTILRCRRMSGTARLASELPAYFPQAAFSNVRVIRYVAGRGGATVVRWNRSNHKHNYSTENGVDLVQRSRR